MTGIDWYAIVDSVGDDADAEQFVTMPAASRLLLMEMATLYGRYNRSGLAEPTEMYKYLSTAQKALAREEEPMDRITIALGTAVPLLQSFPGIVGLWPMTVTNGTYEAVDVSGNGLHLTNNGVTAVKFGSYATFDNNYLSRADSVTLDIRGNWESIENPGLTMGAWVNFDNASSRVGIMGKYDTTGNQRAYVLFRETTNTINGYFSSDGTSFIGQSLGAITSGRWYFVACRFIPSASVTVFVDGDTVQNTTSIPALIFNSSASFRIGSWLGAFDGKMSLCWLSAAAVPDDLILRYYNHTKVLYG